MPLSQQRCFNHAAREPVARCPECLRYFCRECVAEHDSRLLCAGCIAKLSSPTPTAGSNRGWMLRLAAATGGALLVLIVCYSAGRFMLNIPASYHEGTIWKPSSFWSNLP